MICVAIADDHPLVINGVRDMLSSCSFISVPYTYLNGATLLEGLRINLPDVLLLDINMPDIRGEEIILALRKEFPELKVLTLTNFDNTLYASNMIKNGALGYLLKNTDRETLIRAIETVSAGQQFLTDDMRQRITDFQKTINRKTSARYSLTPRETEILRLLARGYSNQQIADELFLSKRTVENYRLNLSLKLEAKNTAGLVKYAIELGLDK
ncbi:response regulator [Taibaiella chishuiensis]|uniref:LuxR family two component transcriptional regulator n=1 Tax=Taibaiella chishuiensis TaxID=1434707 RepID=A0A2P8DBE1_9BACT|nr:response regulator transcription factor [Taibaiella chishuiensis]PSK94540.1 LuxR family two component transcriptional regulator [Taibaiella chishuiensis]